MRFDSDCVDTGIGTSAASHNLDLLDDVFYFFVIDRFGFSLARPFEPLRNSTEVLLTMSWIGKTPIAQLGIPPMGKGTGWYANEALRRSKQLIETGELSTAAIKTK